MVALKLVSLKTSHLSGFGVRCPPLSISPPSLHSKKLGAEGRKKWMRGRRGGAKNRDGRKRKGRTEPPPPKASKFLDLQAGESSQLARKDRTFREMKLNPRVL